MKVTVYGIKNCDSVKKALKFLEDNAIVYDFVDFKKHPPTSNQIDKWVKAAGIKKLFNSRSTTYRNLRLKEKNLNDEEKKEWMCKEPLLIKRPVIESPQTIMVGYDEENFTRSLL